MTPTNLRRTASSLILLAILFSITLTSAIAEDNYKNDNNFLTRIFESTHTENGYKTSIIVNPDVIGIYATENGYKLDLTINTQGIGGSHKENNYKLDLIPEKTFPDIPDIAVTKIATSKTVVGQGYSVSINATFSNQVLNYETFNAIIQANTTTINTQTITLTSRELTTITFTWNTAGVPKGDYTIIAYATPVPGETDTTDNTLADGWIIVTIPGDVNGDKTVNILDCILLANHFGHRNGDDHTPGTEQWRKCMNCDINCDITINILDCIIQAGKFGQKWT